MVDHDKVTKYDRDDRELQEFFIFAVCVAGKMAKVISPAVVRFLNLLAYDDPRGPQDGLGECLLRPFSLVSRFSLGEVAAALRRAGIGCYTQKARAIKAAADLWRAAALDPRTCSVEDLEALPSIGAKTARYFVMHSRPGQRLAALDTHILKHLKAKGYEAPSKTPCGGKAYRRLEEACLALADAAGMSAADYDLMVWKSYRS